MTRTIKLAMAAALALGATSAFATNGDHLIGLGAKARGMGGVGIGMSHGAESGLANPALITSVKGNEISFGGTIFMPDVSYEMTSTGGAIPAGTKLAEGDSAADTSMIPEVSLASKVNDNFYWGIGMWGTAGLGVDYRKEGGLEMVTNLQLLQFGVSFAYKVAGFSIGVTPIMQYGALDINYNNYGTQVGAGVAQDFGYGFTAGAAYDFAGAGVEGLTLGAVYKSAISMEYDGQLSSATQPFVDGGIFPEALEDKLQQPAEIGVGVSFEIEGNTIAVDYKQIKWGDAEGYKDFNWDNQNVYAVGYQYDTGTWAVRLGFNHAENPIKEMPATALADSPGNNQAFGGNAINMFNLLGFPATVENHFSVGGSYAFNETLSFDAAFTYAPETETTFATMPASSTNNPAVPDTDTETTVKHSQKGVSVQLTYSF